MNYRYLVSNTPTWNFSITGSSWYDVETPQMAAYLYHVDHRCPAPEYTIYEHTYVSRVIPCPACSTGDSACPMCKGTGQIQTNEGHFLFVTEPMELACMDGHGHDHDWQPFNETMDVIKYICSYCGMYRTINAATPDATGQYRMSLHYDDADRFSLDWIEAFRDE